MATIFNMVLLLLYATSIIALVSSAINGIKRDNAKALWSCVFGIVFLIAAGVWHWIYFMSGYGFAAVFRDAVDEMMFDITFTFMDIGLPMFLTRIIRFFLVTIPYWIEIALAFLALKGGDAANASMQAVDAAEKAKQAALRAERYARNRKRAVVNVTEDAAPVYSDLSVEDVSRLRMKAKRNELTEDERMLYSEYLRQQQAEGKWDPVENAYKNRKRMQEKSEFDWHGVFQKVRKVAVVLVVVGIGLRFGGSAISSLVNDTFEPGSGTGTWQSSMLESVDNFSGFHGDLSDEDEQKAEYMNYRQCGGSWSFDEWTDFLNRIRACDDEAGFQSLHEELKASGFKEQGGWSFGSFVSVLKGEGSSTTIEDLGNGGGGKQTIEDIGTGAPASRNTNSVSKPANSNQHQSAPAPAPSQPAPSKPSQSIGSPDKVYPYGDGIPLDDGNGGYNDNPDGGGNGTWYDETTDTSVGDIPSQDPIYTMPDSLF